MSDKPVGTRWRHLIVEHGIGTSLDHPASTQRIYAALAVARPGRRRREMATELIIDCTLEDLDQTARFARRTLKGTIPSVDLRTLSNTVAYMDRVVDRLIHHPAFAGRFVHTQSPLYTYAAFRSRRGFYPVTRICPGPQPTAGVLEPYQLSAPAHLDGYALWQFTTSSSQSGTPGTPGSPAPEMVLRAHRRSPARSKGLVD